MPSFASVELVDYAGERRTHQLLRPDAPATSLAIVYPGSGYSSHMPVLYYPTKLLLLQGYEVLHVTYPQRDTERWAALSEDEKLAWFAHDAVAALSAARATRDYDRTALLGKSLGTLALAALLESGELRGDESLVWLTPLIHHDLLQRAIPAHPHRALFVIGTADPLYQREPYEALVAATDAESLVVPGADHIMEIPGDLEASIGVLPTILATIRSFLP